MKQITEQFVHSFSTWGIPQLPGHAPYRSAETKQRVRRIAALSSEYFRLLLLATDLEQRELMTEGRVASHFANKVRVVQMQLVSTEAALEQAKLECHKEAA